VWSQVQLPRGQIQRDNCTRPRRSSRRVSDPSSRRSHD
jgi:hypothetical protein